MPTFTLDPAVDRFLDALLGLDPDQWSQVNATSVSTFRDWRPFLKTVEKSRSASERAALDKHTDARMNLRLGEIEDQHDLNFASMMASVRRGAYALQKREKIGPDAVREWWSVQFEPVGIRFDEMIEKD
ncbi:hypothetical protein [Ruania halotolerans]|uniref:hypothetical protein n=1 Tax=Ruania halotolerans TaxID=2897773 RepID=UPI001E5CA774|nr:hypothetical protein [Ruania halotolerans]UFU06280.1 hypothetical protein LQF10_17935 [Ruania halotolerans]